MRALLESMGGKDYFYTKQLGKAAWKRWSLTRKNKQTLI